MSVIFINFDKGKIKSVPEKVAADKKLDADIICNSKGNNAFYDFTRCHDIKLQILIIYTIFCNKNSPRKD